MLIGLISDTHGHVRNTLEGLQLLASRNVDQILHCGDIGAVEIPRLFERPTHFIFGNVDQDEADLQEVIEEAGHSCHGRFGDLELAGVRIAMLHGDNARKWEEATTGNTWNLVCFGHTHRAENRLIGSTRVVNPGAVYRARPHSVAVVELPGLEVEFLDF